jgi:HK97 family phage major capsid protein
MDDTQVKEAAERLKAEAKTTAETAGKAAAELAVAEVKGELSGVKSGLDEIKASLKSQSDDIDKLALDAARNGGSKAEGSAKDNYAGAFFKEYSDKLSAIKSRQRGQAVEFDLSEKAAVNMLTPGTLPGTVLPNARGEFLPLPITPTHVRELLSSGTIDGKTLEYPRAVAQEGGPAVTAEGAKKPQMSFTFESIVAQVKKIAVYFKLSTEMVADAPAFVSYMQAQAMEAVKDVEDAELLYGDGGSTHLQGIYPLATAFSPGTITVPNATRIDVLRLAVAQVRRAKFRATAIMLNPDDCAALELTKDEEGRYLLPTILTGTLPNIGRVQIIEVDAILPGEFLVGAFDRGAQCLQREGLTIRMFDQNEDDAVKNMVTVVIEERLINLVYRPASFVKGDFETAIDAVTPGA